MLVPGLPDNLRATVSPTEAGVLIPAPMNRPIPQLPCEDYEHSTKPLRFLTLTLQS
jgi:hypothetical protein